MEARVLVRGFDLLGFKTLLLTLEHFLINLLLLFLFFFFFFSFFFSFFVWE